MRSTNLRIRIKFVLFLFFLVSSLFYFSAPAQAHSVETDGSVLMMLHASPDDSPIIGQQASLIFYITDSQKKFKATECNCRLDIFTNDTIIFSTTTFDNVKNNVVFSYIFPQKGTYGIKFIAAPLVKQGFQNFAFNDDDAVVVSRTIEQVKAAKAFILRVYLGLGILILLLVVLFIYKKCGGVGHNDSSVGS